MTPPDWKSLLSYDPYTGELTWLLSTNNRLKPGDKAGYVSSNGYRVFKFQRRLYLAHRIAWYLHHGMFPPNDTDHINGDRADNRIVNLRLATRAENQRNKRMSSRNQTGYKGVHWRTKNQKWTAIINDRGKNVFLGYFDDPKSAHAAYCDAAKRFHGEFARLA